MAYEFLESEVVFSDHHHHRNSLCTAEGNGEESQVVVVQHQKQQKQNSPAILCGKNSMRRSNDKINFKTVANSVPVNIPERMLRCNEEEAEEDDGEGMVPPHVMVERRISGGKMAFSVCTGNGRTLKGRDLSQVRNSILRMTGFLEV